MREDEVTVSRFRAGPGDTNGVGEDEVTVSSGLTRTSRKNKETRVGYEMMM